MRKPGRTRTREGQEGTARRRTVEPRGVRAALPEKEIEPEASRQKALEPEPPAKGKLREMDLSL